MSRLHRPVRRGAKSSHAKQSPNGNQRGRAAPDRSAAAAPPENQQRYASLVGR
jgi:hypothetical protein